jgi:thiamine-phosphate pyrophosphorylase
VAAEYLHEEPEEMCLLYLCPSAGYNEKDREADEMEKKWAQHFRGGLYGILTESRLQGRDNLEAVREMILQGVRVIQYCEPEKSRREKYEECRVIREMCKPAGVLFIVSEDVDIALLAKAGGVHLGRAGLPADAARRLAGPEMIIGVTAAGADEVKDAVARGADYVGLDAEPQHLTLTGSGLSLPLVAMGDMDTHQFLELQRQGITCAAEAERIPGLAQIMREGA